VSAYLDLVFTVAPHPDGEFVEAENRFGHGVSVGDWIAPNDADRFWRLRMPELRLLMLLAQDVPEEYDACVVCGSTAVTERGVSIAGQPAALVGVAWCAAVECQKDRLGTRAMTEAVSA
jgi:hypothetical protein